jgi:hypothetical protein
VTGSVHRHPGVVTEDQRRRGDGELHKADDRQDDPQPLFVSRPRPWV